MKTTKVDPKTESGSNVLGPHRTNPPIDVGKFLARSTLPPTPATQPPGGGSLPCSIHCTAPKTFFFLDLGLAQQSLEAAWAYANGLYGVYVIVRVWAALRNLEAQGLTPASFDLEGSQLHVGTEGRQSRVVDLAPNVVIMLMVLRQRGLLTQRSLNPSNYHLAKMVSQVVGGNSSCSDNGHLKPSDILRAMRPTGLQFHLALTKDPQRTAYWGGLSPSLLHQRHLQFASGAEKFWAMLPMELADQKALLPAWN